MLLWEKQVVLKIFSDEIKELQDVIVVQDLDVGDEGVFVIVVIVGCFDFVSYVVL